MAIPSPRRVEFEPDVVPTTASGPRDQDPVLSSLSALARFEFEAGRGNEGTKILMVEWEDDTQDGSANTGDWEVSWEGKKTVLSARDGAEGKLHRLYFLLAPGTNIPPVVKLAQAGGRTLQIQPLPAIFPPELGARGTAAGKRGILHTRYGKQRLSALDKEIEVEMKTNGEGIGLEMAMQEKQWIEENFGIGPRISTDAQYPASPTSPKTPGGGRLSEKLKGLKLGTSTSELSGSSADNARISDSHPLSPDQGDVAVSSFALFHGGTSRRAVVQNPPDFLVARQKDSRGSRMSSLDEVAAGDTSKKEDNETEDELFAVKLSPRSPEMTKSPFSFTAKDTAPWLKEPE